MSASKSDMHYLIRHAGCGADVACEESMPYSNTNRTHARALVTCPGCLASDTFKNKAGGRAGVEDYERSMVEAKKDGDIQIHDAFSIARLNRFGKPLK